MKRRYQLHIENLTKTPKQQIDVSDGFQGVSINDDIVSHKIPPPILSLRGSTEYGMTRPVWRQAGPILYNLKIKLNGYKSKNT